MWRWILLFTVVPAVELFLLLQLGSIIGPMQTFLIIVVTGTVGAWLAKREGLGVLQQLQSELASGLPPGSRLAEGALVLAGGLLLLTPGVLTDLTGFLFILPFSRRWLAPHVVRAITSRIDVRLGAGRPSGPRPSQPADHPFASPFDDLP